MKKRKGMDFISVASLGIFFVLLGVIFAATPDLPAEISYFVRDFRLENVYPNVSFYAPASNHPVLYNAAFQFCLIFGICQAGVLILEFVLKESVGRKSATFSGLFFWFGAAAALKFLSAGVIDWWVFLGWLVVFLGIAIFVRSALAFVFWKSVKSTRTLHGV